MAVQTRQVNVNAVILLADRETMGGGGLTTIFNTDATFACFIGSTSSVTTANGFKLIAGASFSLALIDPETIYAIGPGSTNTIAVHIFRSGA